MGKIEEVGQSIEWQMTQDDNHPDDLSRSALAAIRNPTPAMIDAANLVMGPMKIIGPENKRLALIAGFNAMIDAALGETK